MLPRRWMEAYIHFLLKFRGRVLILLTLLTLVLGDYAAQMRVYTNFFDLYPPHHPYIQLYQKYRRMFGTADVLLMAIQVKEGAIFNVNTINKINWATLQVLQTPGVNVAIAEHRWATRRCIGMELRM
jgi:predicted RND superfamily exporter protein